MLRCRAVVVVRRGHAEHCCSRAWGVGPFGSSCGSGYSACTGWRCVTRALRGPCPVRACMHACGCPHAQACAHLHGAQRYQAHSCVWWTMPKHVWQSVLCSKPLLSVPMLQSRPLGTMGQSLSQPEACGGGANKCRCFHALVSSAELPPLLCVLCRAPASGGHTGKHLVL